MLKDFTKVPFDIIVQAGQSNARGTGFGTASRPWNPHAGVWYLDQDGSISQAAERVQENLICGDFSLSFARAYLEQGLLAPERQLLIVRAAVGGTGFLDHRWGLQDDLFLQLMDMTRTALALHPENRLVALLWHQGENDADGSARDGLPTQASHYENLANLLREYRAKFGEVPFVAGDFVPQWIALRQPSRFLAPVRAAMRQICADSPSAAFVESEGLSSNDEAGIRAGDTVHFCREALYTFGERYFAAWLKLI
ncbi:MAG: sialate O-acetylesterase [Oscillospiraceae bacterium]|jgi:hypothetical protein|nr:sialate O-acetylesterase [Oscillospiraceae bacterium]